jgi:hypothetical protein
MPAEVPIGEDSTSTSPEDRLRVSDAERQSVVDALSRHTGDGRLGMDEFEERSGRALAARTRGDLRGLLADLPAHPGDDAPATVWAGAVPVEAHGAAGRVLPVPPGGIAAGQDPFTPRWQPASVGPGYAHDRGHEHRRHHPHGGSWHQGWANFVYLSLLMTAIWLMSGAGYFWPMWVIVPVGIGTLCSAGRSGRHRIGPTPPTRL